jgi:hypothetical protein
MSETPATDVIVQGAHALARGHDRLVILEGLLSGIASATGAGSGAILIADGPTSELRIVASMGIDAETAAALTAAVRNPAHAVARTFARAETGFDVLPGAPGGPALRSHAPLIVERDGSERVVGVLALAHDQPIEAGLRPIVLAVTDLAAVAVERGQPGTGSGRPNR